jgi:hypothetical protein
MKLSAAQRRLLSSLDSEIPAPRYSTEWRTTASLQRLGLIERTHMGIRFGYILTKRGLEALNDSTPSPEK